MHTHRLMEYTKQQNEHMMVHTKKTTTKKHTHKKQTTKLLLEKKSLKKNRSKNYIITAPTNIIQSAHILENVSILKFLHAITFSTSYFFFSSSFEIQKHSVAIFHIYICICNI